MLAELLLLAGFTLMLAWYPCCCEEAECTCENCASNATPCLYTVVISGMADDTCSSCELYDGTYIVEAFNVTQTTPCAFWVGFEAHCGETQDYAYPLLLQVTAVPSLAVALSMTTNDAHAWGKAYVAEPDCAAWVDESLPFSIQNRLHNYCTAVSATCTVSSGDVT